MKIISNKLFRKYEVIHRSWDRSKEITLDGTVLIPITVLDKILEEFADICAYEQEVNGKTEFFHGVSYCISAVEKYKRYYEPMKIKFPKGMDAVTYSQLDE